MANLIIVNGAPGVGKSTLAAHLSGELSLPALGKDHIKEFLFDTLGVSDRDWSRTLGAAASDMLFVLAEAFMHNNRSILIENAFYTEFAAPRIQSLADKYQPRVVEVYCFTDDETRMERFRGRQESGQRHRGHVDNLATLRDISQYEPLGVGELIRFDTTKFGAGNYDPLVAQVRSYITT